LVAQTYFIIGMGKNNCGILYKP